jgi:hypothetical protein
LAVYVVVGLDVAWYPFVVPLVPLTLEETAMPVRRITSEVVEKMMPGETRWDAEVKGFGVRNRGRDAIY